MNFPGGEQQRVALIRSLLVKPRILLLDEVTASLDEENTVVIEQLILEQNQDRNVTVLFISHNTGQARRLAHKILHLAKGKMLFYGSKDEFFGAKEGRQ
jgi:ABC-type multidrug transport system ATPase subunit